MFYRAFDTWQIWCHWRGRRHVRPFLSRFNFIKGDWPTFQNRVTATLECICGEMPEMSFNSQTGLLNQSVYIRAALVQGKQSGQLWNASRCGGGGGRSTAESVKWSDLEIARGSPHLHRPIHWALDASYATDIQTPLLFMTGRLQIITHGMATSEREPGRWARRAERKIEGADFGQPGVQITSLDLAPPPLKDRF